MACPICPRFKLGSTCNILTRQTAINNVVPELSNLSSSSLFQPHFRSPKAKASPSLSLSISVSPNHDYKSVIFSSVHKITKPVQASQSSPLAGSPPLPFPSPERPSPGAAPLPPAGRRHGQQVRGLRRLRPRALQADLLRQGRRHGPGPAGHVEVPRRLPPDGADGLRRGAGPDGGGQPGRAELPAVRPRPVRSAGAGAASDARGRDGGGLLPGHGVREHDRAVARALHHDQQEVRLSSRDTDGRAGIEVDVAGRSYNSQLIIVEDIEDMSAEVGKAKDGNFLNSQTFMFKVPQVYGGSTISVKANWSQKLTYQGYQFSLRIPFTFPSYVNPVVRKMPKKEKVLLNVNSGTVIELLHNHISHPLKDLRREAGKLSCLYEAEAPTWSSQDFKFSYSVSTTNISGGVLLQSPSLHDTDQRDIFCFYFYPGKNQSGKVYSKEVVYVIDISASMENLLMNVKNAILESLSRLTQQDSFNIIAFNNEVHSFSSLMEPATPEAISNATQWISANFAANGGTDILFPLEQAMKLLAETTGSIPFIFLVTDGAVENEREICNKVKDHCSSGLPICPRICTFGIGAYCNNYFLQMLSQIGRGYHDAAYDAELVELRMQRWLANALSIMMADITVDALENLDSLEIYPSQIPDLSSGSPLIVSGRFSGKFPELARVSGVLADRNVCTIDLKVQHVKDVPIDRVLAKRQIDDLTAQAWFQKNTQLAEKVARMSIQSRVPSEYTWMILLETVREKITSDVTLEVPEKVNFKKMLDLKGQRVILLGNLGKGFGNLTATVKNIPPGVEEKTSDAANVLVKAASNCCGKLMDRICCMCFIQTCSYVNDRCAVALTQLCTGLACFGCIDCCFDLCECCSCL